MLEHIVWFVTGLFIGVSVHQYLTIKRDKAYAQDREALICFMESQRDEVNDLRRIGMTLIEADERGQGLKWQEAITELNKLVGHIKS